jgi:hypothetical protein
VLDAVEPAVSPDRCAGRVCDWNDTDAPGDLGAGISDRGAVGARDFAETVVIVVVIHAVDDSVSVGVRHVGDIDALASTATADLDIGEFEQLRLVRMVILGRIVVARVFPLLTVKPEDFVCPVEPATLDL